jgi:hypothetical protein
MKIRILLILNFVFWGLFGCAPKSNDVTGSGLHQNNMPNDFVFLSTTERPTEIYRYLIESNSIVQLTNTNGAVVDYGVDRLNGDIAYSVFNERGGADIWLMIAPNEDGELIISCGEETCFSPQFSKDSRLLTYQQGVHAFDSASFQSNSQIRFYDLVTKQKTTLFGKEINNGVKASWSNDGKYFAYYQTGPVGIRILDLLGNEVVFLQGTDAYRTFVWGADSQHLYFLSSDISDDSPVTSLQEFNLIAHEVKNIEIQMQEGELITNLKFSPSTNTLLLGVRYSGLLPNQKIVLFDMDTQEVINEMGDPSRNVGNISWNNLGNLIIFQQLDFESSDIKPEIVIWDPQVNISKTYVTDAYSPLFLP